MSIKNLVTIKNIFEFFIECPRPVNFPLLTPWIIWVKILVLPQPILQLLSISITNVQ